MEIAKSLIFGLIALAIIFGIFLLVRTLVLWYYKIDSRIINQEKIISQNRIIIEILEDIRDKIHS